VAKIFNNFLTPNSVHSELVMSLSDVASTGTESSGTETNTENMINRYG